MRSIAAFAALLALLPLVLSSSGCTHRSAWSDDHAATDEQESKRPHEYHQWPRPELVLFITGRQNGYIEPCGCTGLANQKGGIARRHTLLKMLREKGWSVVPVDVGNQVRRIGVQAEAKFQSTVDALRQMQYQAVAFGPDDLQLSAGELAVAAAPVAAAAEKSDLFVCANVDIFGFVAPYRVVQAGGKKIGITGVLGKAYADKLRSDEITVTPPEPAVRQAVQALQAAGCDLLVLLAHASWEETQQLARTFPDLDVIATAGGSGEPPYRPERVTPAGPILVQTGYKGMYVGLVGVFDDPQKPLRYERIALDNRFGDSRPMLDVLAAYQEKLKQQGLAGLGLTPAPHPSGRSFVGSATCGECHTQAYATWSETPHAHATESIAEPTERSEIKRHFDPECLSCHVTGWNPQSYFPYKSGYLDLQASHHLHGNGCENCHGPGSEHVAAEMGEKDYTERQIQLLREQMRLPLKVARDKCLECHDLDNSPDFHLDGAFEKYWEQVKHYGKD